MATNVEKTEERRMTRLQNGLHTRDELCRVAAASKTGLQIKEMSGYSYRQKTQQQMYK